MREGTYYFLIKGTESVMKLAFISQSKEVKNSSTPPAIASRT